MNENEILSKIRGGIIVSCQAMEGEPLHGPEMMARMALAAKMGGAVGIRANGEQDIRSIKRLTGLPVIGILKREYAQSEVYITPTLEEVEKVKSAGADIVAVDATCRPRPDGLLPKEFIASIKAKYPDLFIMADVSTLDEGLIAEEAGANLVASTMSGYTEYSPKMEKPDFGLIQKLVQHLQIPVIAEGRIRTPEEAVRCFELGAFSVVIGSAITRPQVITQRFVEQVKQYQNPLQGSNV
jgi:N-acylglucosamine-6-phosphate 2-epimerase